MAMIFISAMEVLQEQTSSQLRMMQMMDAY